MTYIVTSGKQSICMGLFSLPIPSWKGFVTSSSSRFISLDVDGEIDPVAVASASTVCIIRIADNPELSGVVAELFRRAILSSRSAIDFCRLAILFSLPRTD